MKQKPHTSNSFFNFSLIYWVVSIPAVPPASPVALGNQSEIQFAHLYIVNNNSIHFTVLLSGLNKKNIHKAFGAQGLACGEHLITLGWYYHYYSMPGTLHTLSHLILPSALQGRDYYDFHFR